jgi:dipeptidyl aminopeptidase/acylaminoacyl peptidase
MRRKGAGAGVLLWSLIGAASIGYAVERPVSIRDCIEMVRVQQSHLIFSRHPDIVFSNDGSQFAATVWRGNLKTNLNEYSLLLFDTAHLGSAPREILKTTFAYDPEDQDSTPLSEASFVGNGRVVVLAAQPGRPRQVILVDAATMSRTLLTHEPNGVTSFAASASGDVLLYSAAFTDPNVLSRAKLSRARMLRDGFSLDDPAAPPSAPLYRFGSGNWSPIAHSRQRYFLVSNHGVRRLKIYEEPIDADASDAPAFWISPDEKRAAVYPYVARPGAQPTVGLIDLASGNVSALLPDRQIDVKRTLRIFWSPGGKSLVVSTFDAQSAMLGAIDLATRSVTWASVGRYDAVGWNGEGTAMLLTRGYRQVAQFDDEVAPLAAIRLSAAGWGEVQQSRTDYRFNPFYSRATNGHLIIGVHDDLSTPPEIAAYDWDSHTARVLTDLNPELRERRYGEVSQQRWSTPYDNRTSVGYLIKPVGYDPRKRYPLIVQLIDLNYSPDNRSFILDGQVGSGQYNGVAAQVWANAGFAVLLTPIPFMGPRPVQLTPQEGPQIVVHVERAIQMLDTMGIIDRDRIAIAGWSWAGWLTEFVVAHSKLRFAAVATTANYEFNMNQFVLGASRAADWDDFDKAWNNSFPWGGTEARWRSQAIDWMYDHQKAPWLLEAHGVEGVALFAETYAALKVLKTPVDMFVYPDAPHAIRSPMHRLHSMATHTDWFDFWLNGREDSSSGKATQYLRWRKLRATALDR